MFGTPTSKENYSTVTWMRMLVVGGGGTSIVTRALVPALAILTTTRTYAIMTTVAPQEVPQAIKAMLPTVYQADLVPLDFTPVGVQEKSDAVVKFQNAAMTHAKQYGSIAFIVRRPG